MSYAYLPVKENLASLVSRSGESVATILTSLEAINRYSGFTLKFLSEWA